MWDYVFSPRLMMIDATAGLVVFVFFRLLRGNQPPSKLQFAMVALAASIAHHVLGGSRGPVMPTGYVGQMVQACMQEESRERCLCAVDSLKERVGESSLIRTAVAAEVNMALPKEFLEALAHCRG